MDDYKDFRCFKLLDDGEREEIDVEPEEIESLFDNCLRPEIPVYQNNGAE